MKTALKLFTCALLIFVLTASSLFAMPVRADTYPNGGGFVAAQSQLLFSGKECSADFCSDLTNMGILVNDDTTFELVSSKARTGATALVVTNVTDDNVSKDLFMALDEQGGIKPISVTTTSCNTRLSDGEQRFRYGMDIFDDASFVFQVTALFDAYRNGSYLRPKTAQFICRYDPNDDFTVTDVSMDYSTEGFECDTNYNRLNGEVYITHSIIINKSSVEANRYYSKTRAYNSERLLCINGQGSHLIDVSFEVNGELYFERFNLAALIH